ncbi:MAG: tryptophan 7-halogenase [Anaerolineales bacterium]|nr:tryptophan 7-halogenase [Anaerolineales bacterium]
MGRQGEDYDLIVVGGGPAGASVATFVAMRGHRVLLLEADHFPRYHIGESLIPATIHGVCRLLGVKEEIEAAGFVRKGGAILRWGAGNELWQLRFADARALARNGAEYAFQVERSRFDTILLRNAARKGVDVREGHRVIAPLWAGERIAGVRYEAEDGTMAEATGRIVADASGFHSPLQKHIGERQYSQFFQNVALFGYFENAGRLPAPNDGDILTEAFAEGWMWHIPLTSGPPFLSSVGAVIDRHLAEQLQGDHEAALQRFIASCPHLSRLLGDARRVTEGPYGPIRVLKDWTYTTSQFWRPGAVLIGDAACFIDPVLSTGVHLATNGGLLAAQSINTFLSGKRAEADCFAVYEKRYRVEYEILYNFLIGFYDMQATRDSYYWSARQILGSEEQGNEAFVRLVSGSASEPERYWQARAELGDDFQRISSAANGGGVAHGDMIKAVMGRLELNGS